MDAFTRAISLREKFSPFRKIWIPNLSMGFPWSNSEVSWWEKDGILNLFRRHHHHVDMSALQAKNRCIAGESASGSAKRRGYFR
jgi:hypothetical protein